MADMSDWSKKDLDKLFQQGMEQDHFEYNPAAWEQMEALLDRDKRRRRVIIWWWSGAAAALVIAVGLWFLVQHPVLEQTKSTPESSLPQANQSESEEVQMKPDSTDLELKNHQEINKNKNTGTPVKSIVPKKKTPQAKPPVVLLELEPKESPNQRTATIARKSEPDVTPFLKKLNPDPKNNATHPPETSIVNADLALLPSPEMKAVESLNKTDDAIYLPEAPPIDVASIKRSEFVLGLRGAGELTSVGPGDFSRRSWNAGIFAEYRLAGKYSLGLGANFIRNQYRAGAGEYMPEYGFWTGGIAPASTEGMCDIIELPLQVSFFTRGYHQNGLFFNAGITSYIMLRESYYYHYDTYDPDQLRRWATDETTQYWFGLAQFSMGYHKMLGSKTSLQFSPYLQVPLSGVGHGHVRLYSIGTSLKFNLHL